LAQHKEQQGFVTFANNTDSTDYLELAYLQALNIKATQRNNQYAVICNLETHSLVTEKHQRVFDYIIPIDQQVTNPFAVEPLVFYLTPFKETIKLESDLLFTRSIDHWWTAFRLRDVCLSTGAKTFFGTASKVRKYRELFDANQLPDVYNGLMYFRFTQTAKNFFSTAAEVFAHWDKIKTQLKNCDQPATTDTVYAITALILGSESVSIPSLDFLNFVHMKSGFNGWSDTRPWTETVMNERDGDVIRINNVNQFDPVHYYDKKYPTKELIKYYEHRILARS